MKTKKEKLMAAGEGSQALQLKKKHRTNKASHKKEKSKLSQNELNCEEIGHKKTNRSTKRKRRDQEKGSKVEASVIAYNSDETDGDNEKGNLSRKRKANKIVTSKSGVYVADELANEVEGVENNGSQANRGKKTSKMRKERRKEKKKKKSAEENANEHHRKVNGSFIEENAKSKEAHKSKKKSRKSAMKDEKLLEEKCEPEQDEVYEISSGDEDSSRGMKKWIAEYYESRPGLKVLQDQIDDFITAHEEQEEQARKEMEAQAAEGGWTVVVHHKGRKKTTDAESGTAVGSVAPAAVMENMAKKKNKEVGVDFYRFQKREAQMNEIMALQSKFEQDKKRIQQLRAARKFRPY